MYQVIRGREVKPGVFGYRVPGTGIFGRSRQPLLDACRQIKRILGPTAGTAGLFREGHEVPDVVCGVEWGAAHTVRERRGRIEVERYKKFDPVDFGEK